mgnify:CR=1 FL=1
MHPNNSAINRLEAMLDDSYQPTFSILSRKLTAHLAELAASGSPTPTRMDLAAKFDASYGAVCQAIGFLEKMGIIEIEKAGTATIAFGVDCNWTAPVQVGTGWHSDIDMAAFGTANEIGCRRLRDALLSYFARNAKKIKGALNA